MVLLLLPFGHEISNRILKRTTYGQKIVNSIYAALPQLLQLTNKKTVWFDYDQSADVLYVSFRRPQDTTETIPIDNHVLLRQRGDETVGLIILNASQIARTQTKQ